MSKEKFQGEQAEEVTLGVGRKIHQGKLLS
jgi:hypothetical protein